MGYRTLELNLKSATDIKDVNLFSNMDVCAVVSLYGDPLMKHEDLSIIDGTNATYTSPIKITINQSLARRNQLTIEIMLLGLHHLNEKVEDMGKVYIPVKELLDETGDGNSYHYQDVSYQVWNQWEEPMCALNFSYRFGKNSHSSKDAGGVQGRAGDGGLSSSRGGNLRSAAAGYGLASAGVENHSGAAAGDDYGYGYLPRPYGGYPQPPPGYGYPPQTGYGYPSQLGYEYPPAQRPAKNGFGMALGAGLLGGVLRGLFGAVISDASGGFDFFLAFFLCLYSLFWRQWWNF